MKLRTFHEWLMKDLKNIESAAGYLDINFFDDDKEFFLVALRDVIEANGGMSKLAQKTKLNRANLYRMMSKKGNPEIMTLNKVLNAVGLCLSVKPLDGTKRAGQKKRAARRTKD